MKLLVGKDPNEWVKHCDDWCSHWVPKYSPRKLFIPAGQTPVSLYEYWEKARPAYLNECQLLQVDEVLTPPFEGRFRIFFEKNLPGFQNQMIWVHQETEPAHLAILGLGLNGHVAFHEPGLALDFQKGPVRLSPITCQELALPSDSYGLTYGLGTFLACEQILLIVKGTRKKEILKRVVHQDPTLPASRLIGHQGLTIVTDIESAP